MFIAREKQRRTLKGVPSPKKKKFSVRLSSVLGCCLLLSAINIYYLTRNKQIHGGSTVKDHPTTAGSSRPKSTSEADLPPWVVEEAEKFVNATAFCYECPISKIAGTSCRKRIDFLAEIYNASRIEIEDQLRRTEPACKGTVTGFQRKEADWQATLPSSHISDVGGTRVLVIYFPQYHPDPLNDRLWGENFTDWYSLQGSPQKNKKDFPIPRPNELGYYDLRNTLIRKRQADLARAYGIDGFLMHHYWFYDTTHPGSNLHAPLMEMLKDGEPNIPFCFNWCATPWNNVWNGKPLFQKGKTNMNHLIVLQEQFFNPTDDMILQHYEWLKPFFHHPNYIKVDGRPVFFLYMWIKNTIAPILKRLSELAEEDGFEGGLYLVLGRSAVHPDLTNIDPDTLNSHMARAMKRKTQSRDKYAGYMGSLFDKSLTYPYPLEWMVDPMSVPQWCMNGTGPPKDHVEEISGIVTAFDNTPRRDFESAVIWNGAPPDTVLERFRTSMEAALYYESCCHSDYSSKKAVESRFIIINAWNEWAEGMSIEPSDVYGRGFLEAVRESKKKVAGDRCSRSSHERKTNG